MYIELFGLHFLRVVVVFLNGYVCLYFRLVGGLLPVYAGLFFFALLFLWICFFSAWIYVLIFAQVPVPADGQTPLQPPPPPPGPHSAAKPVRLYVFAFFLCVFRVHSMNKLNYANFIRTRSCCTCFNFSRCLDSVSIISGRFTVLAWILPWIDCACISHVLLLVVAWNVRWCCRFAA